MFALFVNDVFRDFWQNEIGDTFISNTILKLGLTASEVDLVHYAGISQAPQFYSHDVNKNLVILDQVITMVTTGEGEEAVTEEVITYEENSTISAVVYYENGVTILPC